MPGCADCGCASGDLCVCSHCANCGALQGEAQCVGCHVSSDESDAELSDALGNCDTFTNDDDLPPRKRRRPTAPCRFNSPPTFGSFQEPNSAHNLHFKALIGDVSGTMGTDAHAASRPHADDGPKPCDDRNALTAYSTGILPYAQYKVRNDDSRPDVAKNRNVDECQFAVISSNIVISPPAIKSHFL